LPRGGGADLQQNALELAHADVDLSRSSVAEGTLHFLRPHPPLEVVLEVPAAFVLEEPDSPEVDNRGGYQPSLKRLGPSAEVVNLFEIVIVRRSHQAKPPQIVSTPPERSECGFKIGRFHLDNRMGGKGFETCRVSFLVLEIEMRVQSPRGFASLDMPFYVQMRAKETNAGALAAKH
jgi:hypothetical protein